MTEPTPKPRPRRFRRLKWLAGATLIAAVALVAALPWVAGSGPVRRLVVAQVNRIYAPTSFEVGGVSASWFGPVRLSGLVLRDGRGKAVVSSPTATLDRSPWQLLTARPDYGTLTLHGAVVDVERRADGSIDLADALGPLLAGDDEPDDGGPETRFTLAIEAGTLKAMSPELAAPLMADRLDLTLHCVPGPLTWDVALANPGGQALAIRGSYGTDDPESSDIVVDVEGTNWPLAVAEAGVAAELVFDGKAGLRSTDAALGLSGDAVLTQVALGGQALKGDRPRFDRIEAAWDADLGTTPAIRKLDLASPIADLGLVPDAPAGATRWVGRVDLAALAASLPNTLAIRDDLTLQSGVADLQAVVHAPDAEGARSLEVSARLADLAARRGGQSVALAEPVTLAARVVTRPTGAPTVETVKVDSAFLRAEGQGDLERGVKVDGSFDLGALDRQLRDWVDLGVVRLAGSGRFGADYRRAEGSQYQARAAVEVAGLNLVGLAARPIVRQAARLDLSVQGPAAPAGLPTGWARAHAEARSDGLEAVVDASPDARGYGLAGRLVVPESPAAGGTAPPPPTRIAFQTTYETAADRLELASFDVDHRLGKVHAAGRVDALTTDRVADLSGTTEPDWDALSALVASYADPEARVAGKARPFRISGPLGGGTTRQMLANLDAEVGVELTDAEVFGMAVGPMPLVVRCARGDLVVVPIDTTLNGGRLMLTPDLALAGDESIVLTLGEGSGLDRVAITDEVSRRVLAYIAPVLREATQVEGHLSARVDRATIPLVGPGPEQGGPPLDLSARVAFQQVKYGPGPLMQNILAMSGLAPGQVPALTIDQVVGVTIADDRVSQTGLEITAAEGVAIQFEGSVGLDQTLSLRAGVPLSPRLLGGQQVAADLLGKTRVGLPIGGTLSRPQLDREAFRVGLREQGRQILGRGAAAGASQLLRMLDDDNGRPAAPGDATPGAGAPPAPPAEDVLRGLGRGLLREALDRPASGPGRPRTP